MKLRYLFTIALVADALGTLAANSIQHWIDTHPEIKPPVVAAPALPVVTIQGEDPKAPAVVTIDEMERQLVAREAACRHHWDTREKSGYYLTEADHNRFCLLANEYLIGMLTEQERLDRVREMQAILGQP